MHTVFVLCNLVILQAQNSNETFVTDSREKALSFTWNLGRDAFQNQAIDLVWRYWKKISNTSL